MKESKTYEKKANYAQKRITELSTCSIIVTGSSTVQTDSPEEK
jgi:hypothetical protein